LIVKCGGATGDRGKNGDSEEERRELQNIEILFLSVNK